MKQNPKTGKGAKIKRDNPLQITKKEVLINMIREVELAFCLVRSIPKLILIY
jgi:hypothetical protein